MMRQRPAGSLLLRAQDKQPVVMPRIEDGETLAPAGAEMAGRSRRRAFTAQDKLRILAEADRAAGVYSVTLRGAIPPASIDT
jgi:hypothetical protein